MSRCERCGKKAYACFCPPPKAPDWWITRGQYYELGDGARGWKVLYQRPCPPHLLPLLERTKE